MGVDLGSATTTVSTRRDDSGPEDRDVQQSTTPLVNADDPEPTRTPDPNPDEEPVLVGLAVPASWNSTRRRAHAEAAANAGFDASFLVSEPEAAARQLAEAQGRLLDPGAPLVVYNLGAASCHVAVVHREGDQYRVDAAKSADDIGGRAFDQLLLEHLSVRIRHSDAEYWARVQNPGETVLRAGVLDAVCAAREHLSDHLSASVALPGLDHELRLTREDAEQCLSPAVLRTVSLVEETMREAGVERGQLEALLLVGGASRTPLVPTVLGHHLGVEPVKPELPDLVIAEGTALAGLARIGGEETAEAPVAASPFSRLRTSPDVLVTMMVVVVAVLAFAGVALLNRGTPDTEGLDAGSMTPSPPDAAGEAEPEESDSGGTEEEPADEPTSPEPSALEEETDGPSPTPESATTAATADPTSPGTSASPAADAGAAMPNVVGESAADAERLLAEAGFTSVTTDGERRTGSTYDHCEVTAQSPGSGSQHSYDDPITLEYVYVGTDSC
ncbi:PASTA domain-containing protein [Glycomyces harbinensis]|uniref:PASTA domain-containing protein n=1 Tax=Glycomyces harbinensis TaxID=58114 RepID=A0A1G6ZIE1_9ACTN|nr:PASTA domain-containing protein [Glycomyces harbinensis]